MEKITAPYNFVPLNEKVVTPYWGPSISHDKPFIDSQSGVLEVEMTAHSPVFVRNGEIRKKDKEGKEIISSEFNRFKGKYFVPGSSIKGMLRSFIESMTFCRMEDKVNDVKYSVRDFTKGAKDSKIYDPSEISRESNCGWLRYDGSTYFLTPCGRPGRISHKSLDKISGSVKMSQYYQQYGNVKKDNQKSASAKYKAFPFKNDGHAFKYEDNLVPEDGIGREKFVIDETGQGKKGIIVFTGQPGIRNEEENQGKQYEFIFFDYHNREIPLEQDVEGKPHEIIRNFFYAYYDHDKGQQKEDWRWRKRQLQDGEPIPVFFRLKDKNKEVSAGNLLDMGLALLFKTTYRYSVKDSILNYQKSKNDLDPDFADCLFGYIKKTGVRNFESLKGRVMVSHAFAQSNVKELNIRTDVLGGPKATYYPNYILQKMSDGNGIISGNYYTFKDLDGRIRGWKRYPVRNGDVIPNPPPVINGKVNEEVASKYSPVAEGAKFSFHIAYHNLRKEELGALISALTFHGNKGFFHSIGMAKPLGYGKVSLAIKNNEISNKEALMKEFESYMDYELSDMKTKWVESRQVEELFAMARPSEKGDKFLKYQKMDMDKRINDFNQGKKEKKALLDYSTITGPAAIQGKASLQESEHKKQYHITQARYFASLKSKEKNDPTLIYKSTVEKELETLIHVEKEAIIKRLGDKQIQLREEKARQIALRVKESEELKTTNKLTQPINLDGVKLNSRAFENLEKTMKVYQVKFKEGPLTEETDISILSEKLNEIYVVLPSKEKVKWKDPNYEVNHYFKKIRKWLADDKTKEILQIFD